MSEETEVPSPGAPVGNDRTPSPASDRQEGRPAERSSAPSLPDVTIRSNDVVSASEASRELRRSLLPGAELPADAPEEQPLLDEPCSSAHTGRVPQLPEHHEYARSIPPKLPAPTILSSVAGDVVHHHHHHHHHHPLPATARGSEPPESLRTAPAVPSALRARPKPYQLLLAATAGAIIAAMIATVHTHGQGPIRHHPDKSGAVYPVGPLNPNVSLESSPGPIALPRSRPSFQVPGDQLPSAPQVSHATTTASAAPKDVSSGGINHSTTR